MIYVISYFVVGLLLGSLMACAGAYCEKRHRSFEPLAVGVATIFLWPILVTIGPSLALGEWMRKKDSPDA